MWGDIIGSAITAGAGLVGGKMTADAQNKAARLNAIAQANENAFAREYNERMTREAWAREERMQAEFAKNGIQWRAADARAAGMHPLAALGAQTHSFSTSVGAPQYQPGNVAPFAGASMGKSLAEAGQDIGRAISATRTEDQRVSAFNKSVQDLTLQKMGLENQLLASQIAKINQPATGPSLPGATTRRLLEGQGNAPQVALDSGAIKAKPLEVTPHNPGNSTQEPAPIVDLGYARTPKGFAPVPSKDVKERIEDNLIQEVMWSLRNQFAPSFSRSYHNPPAESPGEGREWYWSPFHFEYRTRKRPQASAPRNYPGTYRSRIN